MRAELEGVKLEPHQKPNINVEVLAAQKGTCAFRTDYQALNSEPMQTPRGAPEEQQHESTAQPDIVGNNNPTRYVVI